MRYKIRSWKENKFNLCVKCKHSGKRMDVTPHRKEEKKSTYSTWMGMQIVEHTHFTGAYLPALPAVACCHSHVPGM